MWWLLKEPFVFVEQSTKNIHTSAVSKNNDNSRSMDKLRLCGIFRPSRVARSIFLDEYFPRRKPPRVRTYDFRQCKHIHIVLTVRLFEPLLDDFVVTSLPPRHLGQTCQAAGKMEVLLNFRRLGVDVQSHMSFIYMLRAFF